MPRGQKHVKTPWRLHAWDSWRLHGISCKILHGIAMEYDDFRRNFLAYSTWESHGVW